MSLAVKDGNGLPSALKSTLDGSDHLVHHYALQSGAWTVSITGAIDTGLPTAVALANGLANPTTPLVGGCVLLWNGSTWDRWTGAVSGTVTANAGTNLNTSALATESGGNLAAAATALQVIDDWDESDRAKVNLIAGQAGVQGGSGTVSANTQRMVLATDVGLPAGTANIGDVDLASAIPAGTNTIGGVMAEHVNESVRVGGTAYPVKRLQVRSAINNAEVVVVPGVASKKIRVLFISISANATFQFELRSNSTVIVGAIGIVANNTLSPPVPVFGYWCETAAGEDLRIFTSGNTSVGVVVNYIEV